MRSRGSEPHWLGSSGPFARAASTRHDARTLSRIGEIVWMRTIILKEEGDEYEGLPGLSRTPAFAPFREAE